MTLVLSEEGVITYKFTYQVGKEKGEDRLQTVWVRHRLHSVSQDQVVRLKRLGY